MRTCKTLLLVALFGLTACSGGSAGDGFSSSTPAVPATTAPSVAPSNLSYSSSSAVYVVNSAIAANAANVVGSVESYSVSPALPAGLTLNASTGVISGTPSIAAATANYTVTASNSTGSTQASISITVNPAAPVGQAYAWYPALDLNQVEFHVGAGAWGPQIQIVAPQAPVITRDVTVYNWSELNAALNVPGSRITIGADIVDSALPNGVAPPYGFFKGGTVTDIDIIIPPGRMLGPIVFGGWNAPGDTINRLRIRGTTVGQYSGGVLNGITFFGNPRDIIFDGIGMRNPGGNNNGSLALNLQFPTGFINNANIAVVNNVIRTAGSAVLGPARRIVFAGNNIVHAEYKREDLGYAEGWGIRIQSEAAVFYRNQIDGVRYHKIRVHPDSNFAQNYSWINSNVLIDRVEARGIWVVNLGTGLTMTASFINNNSLYLYSTCLSVSFEFPHVSWGQAANNSFYGVATNGANGLTPSPGGPGFVNNTFATWQTPPPWNSNGDPRLLIPLVPINPLAYNASYAAPPQTPAGCTLPPN